MKSNLFQYKHSKILMVTIGTISLLQGGFIILQAVYLAKLITALFQGTVWNAVLSPFIYFFIFLFLRHFLQWVKERISYRFAEKTSTEMQSKLLDKLFELGPSYLAQHGTGSMITLNLEGIPNFRKYLELFIPRLISMIFIPVIILIYVFQTDTLSGVVLSITMPIMFVFLALLGMAAKQKVKKQMGTYQMLAHHFVDSLRGIVTLTYLGKGKSHVGAIKNVSEKYRIATNRTLRIAFLSSFSLNFFSSLSIAILAVELGIRLINGTAGLEMALTMLILAPEYYAPVREFGNDFHATMDGKSAGKQIEKIIHQPNIPKLNGLTIPQWNQNSTLQVKGLSKHSEEENRKIIDQIDFSVEGYQKIGIVGYSGAGKSTLIDLIAGFTSPDNGQIIINDESLPCFSVSGWQEQITYIPQHPYIFSASVRDNICWYHPNATDEEVDQAVIISGLDELMRRLPNGLDEKIGQGGRMLSGGEEQRIALARAILRSQPVLLLDEPTAHLDIETELDIKMKMLPFMENKLVFFATHRLHWIKEMDIIFVMDQGRIIDIGTHEELYHRNKIYYHLVERKGGLRNETISAVY